MVDNNDDDRTPVYTRTCTFPRVRPGGAAAGHDDAPLEYLTRDSDDHVMPDHAISCHIMTCVVVVVVVVTYVSSLQRTQPSGNEKIKNPSNLEGKSSKFPRLFRFCLLIWSGSVRVSLLCSALLCFGLTS